MSYSITLSNGRVFTGLKVAGTGFTTTQPISADMFDGGMGTVKIQGVGEDANNPSPYGNGTFSDLEFGDVMVIEGEKYFYFLRLSAEQLALRQLRADIEYTAMMSGVEL